MTDQERLGRNVCRRVAGIPLRKVAPGIYRSADGLFEFLREAGGSSGTRLGATGWAARALLGEFADPDGRYEPLMLDNGLSWAPTLREAVVMAYWLKWEWLRLGQLTYEQLEGPPLARTDEHTPRGQSDD